MAPKFDITENTNGNITLTLNPDAAQLLANTINVKAVNNGGVPPAVYALAEKLSRITQPGKWFGPGNFPTKKNSAA